MEYANVVWSPQYAKDAVLLENVQRRATKMVPELRNLEYEDRLKALKLPSLMYRRRRGDLIETYKYKHGIYNVNSEKLLPPSKFDRTRGHAHKLEKLSCHLDLRKKFYSLRVHTVWNELPREVAEAPSLNSFKGRLDRYLRDLKYSVEFPLPVGGGGRDRKRGSTRERRERGG